MVQEFRVSRCFSCRTFQVQQVKKGKKWCCKLCGEKQSLLKEFGRGSGADCRRHVQKLNARRGEVLEQQEQQEQTARSLWEEGEAGGSGEDQGRNLEEQAVSRWSKYLQRPQERREEAEPEEEEAERTTQPPGSRNVRKRTRTSGWGEDEEEDGWRNGKKPNTFTEKSAMKPDQAGATRPDWNRTQPDCTKPGSDPCDDDEPIRPGEVCHANSQGLYSSVGLSECKNRTTPPPPAHQPPLHLTGGSLFSTGDDFDDIF